MTTIRENLLKAVEIIEEPTDKQLALARLRRRLEDFP